MRRYENIYTYHMPQTEEQKKAEELWLNYFYRCELYDRGVCTAFDEEGNARPRTYSENKVINRNARTMREAMFKEKREWETETGLHITEECWNMTKEHFSRFKFESLKMCFIRMKEAMRHEKMP